MMRWTAAAAAIGATGRYGLSDCCNGWKVAAYDGSANIVGGPFGETCTPPQPLLAAGWRRPSDSQDMTFSATDATGIRSFAFGGTAAGTSNRACDYTRPAPCSNATGRMAPGPPLPEGVHTVTITAQDAARNPASVTLGDGRLRARMDRGRAERSDIRVAVGDNAGNRREGLGTKLRITSARAGRLNVRGGHVTVPNGRAVRARGRGRLSLIRGAWRTLEDTRTDARGRWSVSYPFRGVPGTYPIRALIRRQGSFPFEAGHSRPVRLRIR